MKHHFHINRGAELAAATAAALLLSACAVRPLPPYNPPPLPSPQSPVPQPPPPAQTYPVPGSTLPVPQPPVQEPQQPAQADQRNLVALAADLSGAEVVPQADSGGRGEFAAVYDRATRLLRWKSSVGNLRGEVTGISFNGPADLDQNAPAVIEWQSAAGRASYEGRATLTPAQASNLLAGMWYVNVRTRAFPQGELRGQITIR